MQFNNLKETEEKEVKAFTIAGKNVPIEGTTVKWLSQVGETGLPEYGLRLFTVQPGCQAPEHKHQYVQTQVILTGKFLVYYYENCKRLEREVGPGDYFYISPMEPHGMKNIGNEPGTFFCCMCNVIEEE